MLTYLVSNRDLLVYEHYAGWALFSASSIDTVKINQLTLILLRKIIINHLRAIYLFTNNIQNRNKANMN